MTPGEIRWYILERMCLFMDTWCAEGLCEGPEYQQPGANPLP